MLNKSIKTIDYILNMLYNIIRILSKGEIKVVGMKTCNKCRRNLPATKEFFWGDKHRKDGFYYICRECSGSKFEKPKEVKEVKDGHKVCPRCGNELPATLEYFGKDKNTKSGLNYTCRVCLGGKYTKQPKEGYKFCNKCKRELPATLEYFNSRKETPSGLSSMCKECRKAYSKKYREENKEKVSKYSKKYYQEKMLDPKYRAKQIKWSKTWRKKNPKKVKAYKKQYREENKEAIKEYMNEYHRKNSKKNKIRCKEYNEKNKEYIAEQRKQHYIENRDEMIARQHKRRSKMKGLEYSLTSEQWQECLGYFDNSCAYCGLTEEENIEKYEKSLEQEHFIPISKNGEYTKDNIIPACRSCNGSKCDNDFFDWYPEQDFYSIEREEKILNYLNYKQSGNMSRRDF